MTDNSYRYGLSMRLSGIDPETGQALRPSQKPITIQDTFTAMHAEIKQLRSQLSAREAETDRYRNALAERDAQIERLRGDAFVAVRAKQLELNSANERLAAYDACLTQVREEMPEVDLIRDQYLKGISADQKCHPTKAAIRTLSGCIETLQRHEAANRNAIAIHMASIERLKADVEKWRGEYMAISQDDGKVERALERSEQQVAQLKSDNARLTAANAEYTKRHVEQVARIEGLEVALECVLQAVETRFSSNFRSFPEWREVRQKPVTALASADGQQLQQFVQDSGKLVKGAATILAALDQASDGQSDAKGE